MKIINYTKLVGFTYIIPFVIYLIDPYSKGYLFGYILTLAMIYNSKKLITYIDRDFVFLNLFAISYSSLYMFYI